ncbi:MAG TPA: twin-arginine translocase TatA/TatE family subunit [Terriglobales bacterium]
MGFSETIFLFFLALLIFGPKKLPEIARQLAKVMNDLRRASFEFKSQIESEIAHIEADKLPTPTATPMGAIASSTSKTELVVEPTAVSAPEPVPAAAAPLSSQTSSAKAPDA